jgi:hypothetical protein
LAWLSGWVPVNAGDCGWVNGGVAARPFPPGSGVGHQALVRARLRLDVM